MIVSDALDTPKRFLPQVCRGQGAASLEGYISGAIAVPGLLFDLVW
jgi:hypothetical protein